MTPDTDGIVRRAYLSYSDGQRSWPHLVTWLAGTARSNSIPTATNKTTPSLEARDPVMIAYAGSRGSFATIQAVSVIRGEVPTANCRAPCSGGGNCNRARRQLFHTGRK
ncbi:MAG: hypothetical protein IPP45_09670 [Sphingomonadales bacterium]|nr:hypothetical protein [Sphingomonadales bacterium]